MKSYFLSLSTMFLFINFLFTGCQQEELATPDQNESIEERNSTTVYGPNITFYGLGITNMLHTYRSGPPATEIASIFIRGMKEGEQMLAIDIRPATKVLYGVSNMSFIYTINPSTGVATPVSQTPFSPSIEGTTVAFDFNPVYDRIQLITDKGQNIQISPATGQVIYATYFVNQTIAINGSAFASNYSGAYSTSLYSIDAQSDRLYRQNPFNGYLTVVGATGLQISGEGGFDISRSGVALGVFYATSNSNTIGTDSSAEEQEAYRLYMINLHTGQAKSLGRVKPLIGIAIL